MESIVYFLQVIAYRFERYIPFIRKHFMVWAGRVTVIGVITVLLEMLLGIFPIIGIVLLVVALILFSAAIQFDPIHPERG